MILTASPFAHPAVEREGAEAHQPVEDKDQPGKQQEVPGGVDKRLGVEGLVRRAGNVAVELGKARRQRLTVVSANVLDVLQHRLLFADLFRWSDGRYWLRWRRGGNLTQLADQLFPGAGVLQHVRQRAVGGFLLLQIRLGGRCCLAGSRRCGCGSDARDARRMERHDEQAKQQQ